MDMYKCFETLDKAEKMLYKELEKITASDAFTPQTFKDFSEVVDAMKDLSTIRAMKETEGKDEGYSERYYDDMRMPYYEGTFRGSYDDGSSYRRGRDSMGRYTSRDSYSRHGDDRSKIMDRLTMMMRTASNEQERMTIQKMIDEVSR